MSAQYTFNTTPVTVKDTDSVIKALRTLVDNDLNDIVVINKQKQVVGTFSIREIADYLTPLFPINDESIEAQIQMHPETMTASFANLKRLPVEQIMNVDFLTAFSGEYLGVIIARMICKNSFIVPVVEGGTGKLVGAVTQKELREAVAEVVFG